jgi:hypothetical protein
MSYARTWLCLGCGVDNKLDDLDENGLCRGCVAEQIATAWFANQPSLERDDVFDKILDFQLELHPPREAVDAALEKWLFDVPIAIQRMVS